MTDSAISAVPPSAASAPPPSSPAMIAEVQARKVFAQTAGELVEAVSPPPREDSVALSPQAQALLAASSPPV